MNTMYFDVETTGLYPEVPNLESAGTSYYHGIIQLGLIIHVDGKEAERHNFRICPFAGCVYDPAALEVTGVTVDDIMTYPEERLVANYLKQIIGRYVRNWNTRFQGIAHNAQFDEQFLRAFFKRNGLEFGKVFFAPTICTRQAYYYLETMHGRRPKKTQLEYICAFEGIELTNAHDAMSDIEATRQLHKLLKQRYIDPS